MLDRVVAKHVHTISAHSRDVNYVSFSSHTLATCSGDKTVRLWSLDNFSELPASPLCDHTYIVHNSVFSSFGSYLATCSTDGKLILWNGHTAEKIAIFEHESKICIRVCRFAPNSSMLVTGSDDQTLCLWDITTRRLIRSLEGHESSVTACAFSPDSAYVVSGSTGGDLRIWDARYGHGKYLLFILDAHDLGMTCAEFSPTYGSAGQNVNHSIATQVSFLLATCGFDDCIKLWDFLATSGSPNVSLKPRAVLTGHTGAVMSCCFSPNGRLLASASGDKTVRLWDPLTAQALHIVEGHARFVTSCAFSVDGQMMATASNDRSVMVWKILTEDALTEDLITLEEVNGQTTSSENVAKVNAVASWEVEDVVKWLKELGLGQYEERFRQNAIDGTELLTLQQGSLERELGITALGHRNKMIRAIEKISAHPMIHPKELDSGIPDEYMCPITHEVMMDPVIASDGYTYERAAITAWINSGKTRSPMTNSLLSSTSFVPNRSLKMLIQRMTQK